MPASRTPETAKLVSGAYEHDYVRADEALFRVGNAGDGCYRLEKGLLKILVTSPEGEELIISFIKPGEMVVPSWSSRSCSAKMRARGELLFATRSGRATLRPWLASPVRT